MKRINFALFSDTFFYAVCTFLICFTVARFYTKNIAFALSVALPAGASAGVLSFLHLYKRRQKKLAYLLDESAKKSLSLHLSVCSKSYIENLLLSALEGAYVGGNGICDDSFTYFYIFKMSPVSADDVAQTIKEECQKNKCLLACYISADARSLAEDFAISIKDIGEIYLMLKEKDLLPKKYALGEVKRKGFFARVKLRFTRRLCPSLFICGFTLLAFSFFTFFPIYYLVAGSLLLALSAVCLFFGQPS